MRLAATAAANRIELLQERVPVNRVQPLRLFAEHRQVRRDDGHFGPNETTGCTTLSMAQRWSSSASFRRNSRFTARRVASIFSGSGGRWRGSSSFRTRAAVRGSNRRAVSRSRTSRLSIRSRKAADNRKSAAGPLPRPTDSWTRPDAFDGPRLELPQAQRVGNFDLGPGRRVKGNAKARLPAVLGTDGSVEPPGVIFDGRFADLPELHLGVRPGERLVNGFVQVPCA